MLLHQSPPHIPKATLLSTVDFSENGGSGYTDASAALGQIEVTEEEFALVFRAGAQKENSSCCYMVLKGIQLSEVEGAEKEQDVSTDDITAKEDNTMTYVIIGAADAAPLSLN